VSEHSPLAAALSGCCPECGEKGLFAGPTRFASNCRACGLDFGKFNVGDGPAAFLILIIGAVLTIAAIAVDLSFQPSYWLHLIWLPVGAGLTLLGLRLGKAAMLAQEYRHHAREGRIAK
jgi:uncharacterized protein (DUF983 family)